MIPIKQRDDFSAWLRKQGVVRIMSHAVARNPGKKWAFIRCGDGWTRVAANRRDLERKRARCARFCQGVSEVFIVSWKMDPQPGPNSWEKRSPIRLKGVRCAYRQIGQARP